MAATTEKSYSHIGETKGAEDHDRDLVLELGRRLEFLWHCDQFIANADGDPGLQNLWRELKKQEQANVARCKKMIIDHVKKDCF